MKGRACFAIVSTICTILTCLCSTIWFKNSVERGIEIAILGLMALVSGFLGVALPDD